LRLNAPALVVQEVGEGPKNTRTVTSFFVMPYTLLVVLTSSISGDLQSLLCTDPPHYDWGQAGAACNGFARDDKELGSQLGLKQTPRKTPW
jgi:hypothetical protein